MSANPWRRRREVGAVIQTNSGNGTFQCMRATDEVSGSRHFSLLRRVEQTRKKDKQRCGQGKQYGRRWHTQQWRMRLRVSLLQPGGVSIVVAHARMSATDILPLFTDCIWLELELARRSRPLTVQLYLWLGSKYSLPQAQNGNLPNVALSLFLAELPLPRNLPSRTALPSSTIPAQRISLSAVTRTTLPSRRALRHYTFPYDMSFMSLEARITP